MNRTRNRHCLMVIRYGTHSLPVVDEKGIDRCTGCSLAMTEPEVMEVIQDIGYFQPHPPIELTGSPF